MLQNLAQNASKLSCLVCLSTQSEVITSPTLTLPVYLIGHLIGHLIGQLYQFTLSVNFIGLLYQLELI